MGKSYNDVKNNASFFSYKIIDDDTDSLVKVQVGDKFYSPVELSSFILKELKTPGRTYPENTGKQSSYYSACLF